MNRISRDNRLDNKAVTRPLHAYGKVAKEDEVN